MATTRNKTYVNLTGLIINDDNDEKNINNNRITLTTIA